jgi:hypothetical protein
MRLGRGKLAAGDAAGMRQLGQGAFLGGEQLLHGVNAALDRPAIPAALRRLFRTAAIVRFVPAAQLGVGGHGMHHFRQTMPQQQGYQVCAPAPNRVRRAVFSAWFGKGDGRGKGDKQCRKRGAGVSNCGQTSGSFGQPHAAAVALDGLD